RKLQPVETRGNMRNLERSIGLCTALQTSERAVGLRNQRGRVWEIRRINAVLGERASRRPIGDHGCDGEDAGRSDRPGLRRGSAFGCGGSGGELIRGAGLLVSRGPGDRASGEGGTRGRLTQRKGDRAAVGNRRGELVGIKSAFIRGGHRRAGK